MTRNSAGLCSFDKVWVRMALSRMLGAPDLAEGQIEALIAGKPSITGAGLPFSEM